MTRIPRWCFSVLVAAATGCADDSGSGSGQDTESEPTGGSTVGGGTVAGDATVADVTDGGPSDSMPDDDNDDDDDSPTGNGFPEPALDDCITDGSAGEHTFSCGGLTFDLSLPAECLSSACGLIVDVHGRTVSGKIQDNNTNMRALGAERGYIVVQPNAAPGVPDSNWSDADDAPVLDFIQRTIAAFHVDDARVHMTGFSQGGFMTWRLACRNSELFASVAPSAACGFESGNPDCDIEGGELPSTELPILYSHGTMDTVINFSCAAPRREALAAHYALDPPETIAEGNGHRWFRHAGEGDMVLEFIEHDYRASSDVLGGHCIVGGNDPGTEPGQLVPISCQDEPAFTWGRVVIDFFEAHPKKR
ncbi:MAG: hypothetical protein AAF721_13105 [Myxococcota bacterium]